MRFPFFSIHFIRAAALTGGIALLLIASSGCTQRGARGDYALPVEQRPLEVPPELDLTANNDGRKGPALASVVQATTTQPTNSIVPATSSASATANSAAASGFVVSGSREEIYNALGQVLAGIEGVTIASRSQMLTSFDVAFADSRFLLRVTSEQTGTHISAVDARGLPVSEPAAVQLLELLKASLSK